MKSEKGAARLNQHRSGCLAALCDELDRLLRDGGVASEYLTVDVVFTWLTIGKALFCEETQREGTELANEPLGKVLPTG